jgi:YgiT-type zinc finger domain-containing protein
MCFFCKGDLKQSITTYTITIDNCVIIIKNVPCEECQQCGEQYFSTDVTKKLENIVNKVKNSISEVTIVDYNNQAA